MPGFALKRVVRAQERQVSPVRSYLSQTELTLTFGIGAAELARASGGHLS